MQTVEKFSNATLSRQIALQNLQRKNLGFSETGSLGKWEPCLTNQTDDNENSFKSSRKVIELIMPAWFHKK